ncbi:hypothetical protein [Frankia sp. Cppng1_Ct_nod]|uniref:hypothetical protein n=1 Tax=Frankia sp. Cppng1_Ct_nod TaxID=2897162 RepID=UPI0013EFAD99|nr:hypothetical protein [Frankia sp. Cppng1_Ct_nod]
MGTALSRAERRRHKARIKRLGDEITLPGTTINPADAGYQPLLLTDPALRRRDSTNH